MQNCETIEQLGIRLLANEISWSCFNTLRPRQDGRHFADDIFTCKILNENCCIFIKFSLKYVRKGPIDNNPPLVQIMAWRRPGDKSLSEPMMVSLLTHICVTRPQWVKMPFWRISYIIQVLRCKCQSFILNNAMNMRHSSITGDWIIRPWTSIFKSLNIKEFVSFIQVCCELKCHKAIT